MFREVCQNRKFYQITVLSCPYHWVNQVDHYEMDYSIDPRDCVDLLYEPMFIAIDNFAGRPMLPVGAISY